MMRRLPALLLGALALMLAAGCGPGGSENAAPAAGDGATAPDAPEKVTLVLNWFPEAEHGGFYAALVHGYYAEAGIDMEIQPGGVDIPVIQLVDRGRVDFGVANADSLMIGRSQGADVVAVMTPIQTSPRCLVVRADSAIHSFDDLRDLTLAMSPKAPFAHFLKRTLPLPGVEIVGYPGNVAPLLTGQVQALQGYNFSEPYIAQTRGVPTRSLMVSDLGFNPYTSCLLATGRTLAERPDLVRRVVAASVRGWATYHESPERTNAHITTLNPEMGPDILAFGAETIRPLMTTDEAPLDRLGLMTAARWEALETQLTDLEIIKPGSAPAAACFTNDFLPAPASE